MPLKQRTIEFIRNKFVKKKKQATPKAVCSLAGHDLKVLNTSDSGVTLAQCKDKTTISHAIKHARSSKKTVKKTVRKTVRKRAKKKK